MSGGSGLLAGKFRVIRQLGQGGMGAVYEVENVYLGQRVAMKLLLDEMVGNQAIVERFLREARASALLRGEHVCKVFDVGTIENGAPYIVMEMLQGRDLSSLLSQQGAFPPHVVAEYVLQACLGVAEAHAAKIVHRDLKPANLFLAQKPDGTSIVKVLDFGIAKAPTEQAFNLTQTAAVMGSPGYMSPEQLRSSRNVDARSDIWSIGTILFELSTGRPPFLAETITELAVRVSMDPTPVPQNVPPQLQRVIYRCLEKNPDQRFQNVAELANELAPIAGPRGSETAAAIARILGPSRASSSIGTPAIGTPTTLGGASGQAIPLQSRGRRWPVIAGVILAAGVAVAIAVVARGGSSNEGDRATQNATTPTVTIDAAAPVIVDASVAVTIDAAIQPAATDAAIDAAVIAPPVDAAPVAPVTPDAGVRTKPKTPKPKPKPGESYENSRY